MDHYRIQQRRWEALETPIREIDAHGSVFDPDLELAAVENQKDAAVHRRPRIQATACPSQA